MRGLYLFDAPLVEGLILSRPNRFIMNVMVKNREFEAHCPATGKIMNIDFNKSQITCLLTDHLAEAATWAAKKQRRTQYTVEAISLDSSDQKSKTYIGINQGKNNAYVHHFLKENMICFLPTTPETIIEREVKVGAASRLDFRINHHTLLEIKSPLSHQLLKHPIPAHVTLFPEPKQPKKSPAFYDRLIKHFGELGGSLAEDKMINQEQRQQAWVGLVYIYDALPFIPPPIAADGSNSDIFTAAQLAADKGVQRFQLNLQIDAKGVSFLDCFALK